MLLILVYFPLGECVDGFVNNGTNHQFTSVIVIHFMNSARTVFIAYVCLSHSWRYKHNQFEKHDEKPRHQRQFLSNIYI